MEENKLRKVEEKESFKNHYLKFCPDYELFMKFNNTPLKRAIRVNTLKIDVDFVKKRLKNWKLEKVPWCKEGFTINVDRRDIGNTIEHSLGLIYIQEPASMIPAIVLDPQKNEFILDMAASPGSKTTQIASIMENTGLLIANDYKGDRLKALGLNVQRMGITNTALTLQEGRMFRGFEFDRILVDAPCSGTGAIRKSIKTIKEWNIDKIRRLSGLQKQLIQTAFDNLKVGGTLVYSTCSLEPEENEAIVSWLIENNSDAAIEKIDSDKMKIKSSPIISEFNGIKYDSSVENCLRIWPQDNDTEGFFVAKIIKK